MSVPGTFLLDRRSGIGSEEKRLQTGEELRF